MRVTSFRAVALFRSALIAAGLGIGWLLLSGAAASASSDLLGVGDGETTGSAGPSAGPAALASAFFLAPLLAASSRPRPSSEHLPSSPAFDPGSTPD